MIITNTSQNHMCTDKWTFCPRHNYYKYDKGCVNHPLTKIELFFISNEFSVLTSDNGQISHYNIRSRY